MLVDDNPGVYAAYLATRQPGDTLDPEGALTGATHEQVGAAFAAVWNLPPSLAGVLGAHHDHPTNPLAMIVRTTDDLVPGFGRSVDAWSLDGQPVASLAALGIDTPRWIEGLPRLRDELSEMLTILAIVA